MKHVKYSFPDEIFKYGDTAYYFYIILKGSVGVKVPTPVEITCSYSEYIHYLVENYNDVWWDKIENAQEIRAKVESQLFKKKDKRGTYVK